MELSKNKHYCIEGLPARAKRQLLNCIEPIWILRFLKNFQLFQWNSLATFVIWCIDYFHLGCCCLDYYHLNYCCLPLFYDTPWNFPEPSMNLPLQHYTFLKLLWFSSYTAVFLTNVFLTTVFLTTDSSHTVILTTVITTKYTKLTEKQQIYWRTDGLVSFNKRFFLKPNKMVNYVSNVDAIT